MNRIPGFCLILLLNAVALAFGADMYPAGSVSVILPPNPAPLSLNVPGVMAALQTAGAVLAPEGFVYGVGPENSNMQDRITFFIREDSAENPAACDVLLRNDRVVFSFRDPGIPNSSSATVRLCNELAAALRVRFEPAAVEVRLK
jgi:hypothetical protein